MQREIHVLLPASTKLLVSNNSLHGMTWYLSNLSQDDHQKVKRWKTAREFTEQPMESNANTSRKNIDIRVLRTTYEALRYLPCKIVLRSSRVQISGGYPSSAESVTQEEPLKHYDSLMSSTTDFSILQKATQKTQKSKATTTIAYQWPCQTSTPKPSGQKGSKNRIALNPCRNTLNYQASHPAGNSQASA